MQGRTWVTTTIICGVLALGAGSGCASRAIQGGVPLPDQAAQAAVPVDIAVVPFLVNKSDDETGRATNFEGYYFSARLVGMLRRHPAVRSAVLIPDRTLPPSAQVLVTGEITEADGEATTVEITCTTAGGDLLFAKTFSYDLDSDDYGGDVSDPFDLLFVEMADDVGGKVSNLYATPADATRATVSAYLGHPYDGTIAPAASQLVDQAASAERQLLVAVTDGQLAKANELNTSYMEWQRKTVQYNEERRSSNTMAALSFAAALAGAAAQGMSTPPGAPAPTQLNLQTQQMMRQSLEYLGKADAADSAAEQIQHAYSNEVMEPKTVELSGEVYKLQAGTFADQLAQLNTKVRDRLTKMLAA
jgi:hypothetical protein